MATISRGEAIRQGYGFEREVAAIFRTLGAKVEIDVGMAGSQIDIVIKETTQSGREIVTAVECKATERPLGRESVQSFALSATLLRDRGLVDRAIIVSRGGFTHAARDAGSALKIELIEFDDLLQRTRGMQSKIDAAGQEIVREQTSRESSGQKRIFVVMPFAKDFDDVYVFGIREVAEKLGFVVERADDIEHNESILEILQARIRAADAIIADGTGSNPNVFYEIGYAHALNQPTVLLAKKGSALPFDVRAINHIVYETIVELRERLTKRLKTLL